MASPKDTIYQKSMNTRALLQGAWLMAHLQAQERYIPNLKFEPQKLKAGKHWRQGNGRKAIDFYHTVAVVEVGGNIDSAPKGIERGSEAAKLLKMRKDAFVAIQADANTYPAPESIGPQFPVIYARLRYAWDKGTEYEPLIIGDERDPLIAAKLIDAIVQSLRELTS
jgi:hypothetical protein